MRDYGKVSPAFWTRGSGKALRGDAEAQVVALYLVTCPSATMLGLYYLPLPTLCHETGLGFEGASKGLRGCAAAGFAFYDEASELVWVPNCASYQLGDALSLGDRRRVGVARELARIGNHAFVHEFYAKYASAFQIEQPADLTSPLEGASKPLPSPIDGAQNKKKKEEEEEEEEEKGLAAPEAVPASPKLSRKIKQTARATRIDPSWQPSDETTKAFRDDGWDPAPCVADFVDYWRSRGDARAAKVDWEATFRIWVRKNIADGKAAMWREPESATRLRQAEPGTPASGPPVDLGDPASWTPEFTAQIADFHATTTRILNRGREHDPINFDVGEHAPIWKIGRPL